MARDAGDVLRLAVVDRRKREQAEIRDRHAGAGDRRGKVRVDAPGARMTDDHAVEAVRSRRVRRRCQQWQHLSGMNEERETIEQDVRLVAPESRQRQQLLEACILLGKHIERAAGRALRGR